jgi:hypothetical protein
MKVAIDTSSLLSLVRYYLPFDKDLVLFEFIKNKIVSGEIIIIDKVFDECKYNSRGIVLAKLNYLSDNKFQKEAKIPFKTDSLIAPSPSKFLRQIDNQFVNHSIKKLRKISEIEYESQKTSFLKDADMKLIIYCLNEIKNTPDELIIIVTEESEASNDNKLFKKIPAICKELNIISLTLPELLEKYNEINIEFK